MDTTEASEQVIHRSADRLATVSEYSGPDRRRPGRPQEISPHLVALLRDDERRPVPVMLPDVHRAAVGLGAAVMLTIPLWVMLGTIVWALFG